MRAFAIISVTDGVPNITKPVTGWAQAIQIDANFGLYLVSGTGPQLLALDATPEVTGICSVTEGVGQKWPELSDVISPAVRVKLNTWLTNRGKPTIPAGWTNRRVLEKAHDYFNGNANRVFDPMDTDIKEP